MSGDFGLGDFGDVGSVVETVADAVVDTALITNRGFGYGYGGYGGWGYGFGGARSTGFLAAFLGLCLLITGILLIHWNETQGARQDRLIDKRLKTIVELDAASTSSQLPDTIVHATGLAEAETPVDALLNVSLPHAIALERKVEMYQWQEKVTHKKMQIGTFNTGDTTAIYDKAWLEEPVNSSRFQYADGHMNPDGFPIVTSPARVKGQAAISEPLRSQHFDGEAPHLGAYTVAPELASQMTSWTPLTISAVAAPAGFSTIDGTMFYRGNDSTDPQIGDVRVTFRAVMPQTYSVIGTVQGTALTGYHNGFNLALAKPGQTAVADMLKTHSYRPQTQVWLIRFLAFGMVFIALLMMASPIEALVGWIPILGGLVEMGLMFAALTLAVPVTATAIALAWIGQRPVAAIAIFAAGGTLGGIMWWNHLRIARHNAEVKAYMARHDARYSVPLPAHHSEFSQF
jgi:hypothetical protein